MGWTYNTVNPDAPTIGPLITGVCTALTAASFIVVCLRVYVRTSMINAFGIDDGIIIVSWVCCAGFSIVTSIQTKWGLGLQHISDLPEENIYNFGLVQFMGAPFYVTSILGFKLSLLFSYLRFMPKGHFRKATIGIIVGTVMFHLSFLIVQVNLCQPVRKQWDTNPNLGGSCIQRVPFYSAMASLTILSDVIVMLVPFPVLLKLKIQTRKKLVLLGLFGLGLFITVIQIIRIQGVKQIVNYTDSTTVTFWSAVENNLGVIVASVPTLAPLVKYYSEKSQTSDHRSGYPREAALRYAHGPWKTNASRAMELGSDHDASTEMDSFEGHIAKGDTSTENILSEIGITKRVDVVITRNSPKA